MTFIVLFYAYVDFPTFRENWYPLCFQCLQTLKNSLPYHHYDTYKNNMSIYTYCIESPSTLNKWFYVKQKSMPKDFITPDLVGREPDHVLHICPTELGVNPRQTCDRDCLGYFEILMLPPQCCSPGSQRG